MAERVLQHTATIPAGTMGFYLANNGVPWVPRTAGEWFIWDDHAETFVPTDYPNAAGWSIVGYNLGAYDHAVVVRFHVNPTTGLADQSVGLPVITFVERGVKHHHPVVL